MTKRGETTQKAMAEHNLALATDAANSLVVDIAQKFRDVSGVPASLVKTILDRARDLQQKLLSAGQTNPDLLRGEGVALDETFTTLKTLGDTAGALDAARKEAAIFEALQRSEPANADYQYNLSMSDTRIGDVELDQGHLGQALATPIGLASRSRSPSQSSIPATRSCRTCFRCSTRRSATCEDDQGQFAQALDSYRKALAIREGLVKSDPKNADWQSNLSVSYQKVGDVEVEQGQYAQALDSYRAEFALVDGLARADPGNTGRQSSSFGVLREGRRSQVSPSPSRARPQLLSGRPRASTRIRPGRPGDRRAPRQFRSQKRGLAARSFGVVPKGRRRGG